MEAFGVFADRFPDSALVIAGAGPLEIALKKRGGELGKPVVFVGELDRQSLANAMGAADAVVLASSFEGMPNVLLEAMASRRAVIATCVDGSAELVDDGVDGLLVPVGDTAELVKALTRLVDAPSMRLAFGEAGRRKVERSFTIERNTLEHARVYEEVISTCRSEAGGRAVS